MKKMNTETKGRIIQEIRKAVHGHDAGQMQKSIDAALNQGVSEEQMRQAIFQEMEHLRKNFMSSQEPLPNFLISLDIVYKGLSKLTAPDKSKFARQTVLVIGTVLGDPHFLGKNIIARVYGASGYQVYDLGRSRKAGRGPGALRHDVHHHGPDAGDHSPSKGAVPPYRDHSRRRSP